MRVITLTESRPTRLRLTPQEAGALLEAGRRLASDRGYWGSQGPVLERSVIQGHHLHGDEWQITVTNVVGTIVLGNTLQINVTSKIPEAHLLYLFSQSDVFPRLDRELGGGAIGTTLWELVAEWYVRATERVLRRELMKDYETLVDELSTVRGQLNVVDTTTAYCAGRIASVCVFDEFGVNTPLNRVLKAAARAVLSSPQLTKGIRRRARSLLLRMAEVGSLRPADFDTGPDRRTAHYEDAHSLARHVLRGVGRSLSHGEVPVWTFLLRTPELVEAGIRHVIKRAIPEHTLTKRGLRLPPTTMTLNPDLVFGTKLAVADVKYKMASTEWKRGDLYQVVTFATAYRVADAAIIEFQIPNGTPLPVLPLGDLNVHHLVWPADIHLTPLDAAGYLVASVQAWLEKAVTARSSLSRE
jgi:5-methylcytosine-specific restriction enzyme subunit McrC